MNLTCLYMGFEALNEFKAKAKDAGLKVKTAPVRAKEAEKRRKAGEETLF